MSSISTLFRLTSTKRLMICLVLVTLGIIALVLCTDIGDIHASHGHGRQSVRCVDSDYSRDASYAPSKSESYEDVNNSTSEQPHPVSEEIGDPPSPSVDLQSPPATEENIAKNASPEKTWTWTCEDHRCVRREWPNNMTNTWSSLPTCRVTCGQTTYIWPIPTGKVVIGKQIVSFHLSHVQIHMQLTIKRQTRSLLREAFNLFRDNLQALVPDEELKVPEGVADVVVNVNVYLRNGSETFMTLNTNESYTLVIQEHRPTTNETEELTATIQADCFFGARHALETLSQLMWWESDERGSGSFKVPSQVSISDHPVFKYRGVMIDTSRNFMPMADLRTTINGMAASKLNTLHLHLTDSQSFSFESTRYPQMSRYGAYASDKVYSARDLKALSAYARVRGVRLLPEVDAPAHAAAGWQWGQQEGLGELAVCINQEPWEKYCGEPPCGQLNPSNDNTYRVLGGIYEDLIEVADVTDMFHVGGDEINKACWMDSTEVFTNEEKRDSKSFNRKVIEFHDRAYKELRAANNGTPIKNVVVWSSSMRHDTLTEAFPPDSYIIQEWLVSTKTPFVDLNYRVILSHVEAWYLDCGFGSWKHGHKDPCSPASSWQNVYSYRPWERYRPHRVKQVLGGEVCLWSEKVDANTVDARVWPRAAALAERLWTDPRETHARDAWSTQDTIIKDATLRLSVFRDRLLTRGVEASAMWPQWCADNPEACF